jgi:hypothetical protein
MRWVTGGLLQLAADLKPGPELVVTVYKNVGMLLTDMILEFLERLLRGICRSRSSTATQPNDLEAHA